MTTATLIQRFSKTTKLELNAAAAQINLDGYTISSDNMTITCDDDTDGSFYTMMYFRNGAEVIAVPDFYIGEDGVLLNGSRGGEYELNGEELIEV